MKYCRYEEDNLKVGRKKTNLMFIGDGRGKTIISGSKSVADHLTTFHTAAFGTNSFHLVFLFSYKKANTVWVLFITYRPSPCMTYKVARGLSSRT